MAAALHHVRQGVKTRAVAHGRSVQHRAPGSLLIHVGKIAEAHGKQIAMAQYGPFRPAGRAARIEKPCGLGGRAVDQRQRLTDEQRLIVGAAHFDDPTAPLAAERSDWIGELGRGETDGGPAVIEDVGELRGMQPRVHRYRHQPRMPAGVQDFEVLGAIAERERHAVTVLQRVALA